jgi:CBS domain-containing protein
MKQPITVQEFMSRDLVKFLPGMDVLEAARILVDKRISGAPVVDPLGNLLGVLSEKDCLKTALSAGYHEEWGGRVEEYMSRGVVTLEADTSVIDAARRFLDEGYRRYPVVSEGRLVGLISRRDILRALSTLWWTGRK